MEVRFFIHLIFLLSILSQNAFADFRVETAWNLIEGKKVNLKCDEYSAQTCIAVCNDVVECSVPEGLCYNCVGNDLFIVNFYKNLGLTIHTTGYRLSDTILEDTIARGNYITLKANSVYNIISDYDSKSMKRKFKKLCPETITSEPIVFAEVDRNRKPTDLLFVVCDSEIYEMSLNFSNYSTESNLY